jgi:hypothetical protein
MPMTDVQRAMHYTYLETLSIAELQSQIDEAEHEIKCLGEMAESARQGYAPHGPSEEDCETEIASQQEYLEPKKTMHKLKTLLAKRDYELISYTAQFYSQNFFICGVMTRRKTKKLFIYNADQTMLFDAQGFHTLRRYCDNHQDDF